MIGKELKYCNLDWYVIRDSRYEKLLFLKNNLPDDVLLEYFTDKSMVDLIKSTGFYGVKFNKDNYSPWWEDSYIREGLNGPFLKDMLRNNGLNVLNLKEMKTTLEIVKLGFGSDGRRNDRRISKTTTDYVRLLTIDDLEYLHNQYYDICKNILGLEEYNSDYWTMSPVLVSDTYFDKDAKVYSIIKSEKSSTPVTSFSGIRPVISLEFYTFLRVLRENGIFIKEEDMKIKNEFISTIYSLYNKQFSIDSWLNYYNKYFLLKDDAINVELIGLLKILARALLDANVSLGGNVDDYNSKKEILIKELENSRKLIITN